MRFNVQEQMEQNKRIPVAKAIMLVMAVVWCGCLAAQDNRSMIKGFVTDSSGKALAGASVVISGSGKGTITNKDGRFSLRKPDATVVILEISYTGFQTQYLTLNKTEVVADIPVVLQHLHGKLAEVELTAKADPLGGVQRLPDVSGTYLMGGKKTEVIAVQQIEANITLKTGRQLFAKVPGVFVYDMDGSGNQVNIATRSLDAHRSWEYNIRYNGVITNSDMYGYPASHFNPPMESVQSVELVRGTASLQYGAQFGGMLNYVSKKADTTRPFGFESINTIGSYGLLSTYNAASGRIGKLTYYGYFSKRVSKGYRDNAASDADGQFLSLAYQVNPSLVIRAEFGHSKYVYQLPGPLNDSMFRANPRMASRNRNWYSPDIYLPSLTAEWKFGEQTFIQATVSGVFGTRNSVQFIGFSDAKDTINPATGQYKNRQVDIDRFNSLTGEIRIKHTYTVAGKRSIIAGGVQVMHNDLNRRQQGKGTAGSDYDLTLVNPVWGRDLHFYTNNIAVFAENMIYLNENFSVSPGFRWESGATDMRGQIGYYDSSKIPLTIRHQFPLFGINAQYRFGKICKIYGGISQAYRPVIFKDVIPTNALEVINPDLKDARGYNAELGVSGRWRDRLSYDISYFHLIYLKRMGALVMEDAAGQSYNYRTNTGNSATDGLEIFLELAMLRKVRNFSLNVFTSTAWMNARYTDAVFMSAGKNVDVSGNRLESAPVFTSRNGIRAGYRMINLSLQYSYVSETYSDPLNTVTPVANGSRGLVPSYGLWDLDVSAQIHPNIKLRMGMNNLTDVQYFTKRPTFYPDPGIWPSDGRNVYMTLGVKL
ncbi:MAG: TonB-dependent receptor [Chitinophagaceae bacterium]